MNSIYTIGHSNHSPEYFLSLLKSFHINCLVDVRSIAASRFNPQFNKKSLAELMRRHDITYMHFAEEFGARRNDPLVLDNEGRVDFVKVRNSASFRDGVERLKKGIGKGFTIALMCAESDPLDCHRFGMISPALSETGFDVLHILKDGSVITQKELEGRLTDKFRKKKSITEYRENPDKQREAAYRLLNQKIGYKPSV